LAHLKAATMAKGDFLGDIMTAQNSMFVQRQAKDDGGAPDPEIRQVFETIT
jgi:hypothetical protein